MTPKFNIGDRVRVRVGAPPGHFRTPAYIQGRTGAVQAIHGAFPNPESLACGGDGLPAQALYLVRFDQTHVCATCGAPPQDKLLIDIYEHWLEPA